MSLQARALDPLIELQQIGAAAIPLEEFAADQFAILRKSIGSAQVVLLGEETHGTEEFYRIRSDICKALIEREGFSAVLCEADFPAFYELNRYIGAAPPGRDLRGKSIRSGPSSTEEAMGKLKTRFPVWMWRNEPFRDFVTWLREHNRIRTREGRQVVHLNGLDIYSMFESADEVVKYLEQIDDNLAAKARKRYETLGTFRPEAADYCRAIFQGKIASQAPQVASMLTSLNTMNIELSGLEGDGDEFFNAVENARVVGAAEEYYRKSYMGGNVTWNIRDDAMVKMIDHMIEFQERKWKSQGVADRPRVLVWAHNSHVGDALATEHHERRQFNVGRLVRAKYGLDNSFIVGFSTYSGTVRAARTWNGRDYVMDLNASLPGSTGHLFHRVAKQYNLSDLAVITRTNMARGLTGEQLACRQVLNAQRLERFVGVQYIKRTERQSHYSYCSIGEQFDAVIHIDQTSAVKPLPQPMSPSARPGTVDYRKFENFDETASSEEDLL